MHRRITVQQCKEARGLLKWNQRELSIRASVRLEQIEAFERREVTLFKGENQSIWEAFLRAGIEMDDKGGLVLVKVKRAAVEQVSELAHSHTAAHDVPEVVSAEVGAQGAVTEPHYADPVAYALWQQQMYHEVMLRQQQMMMSPQGVMPVVQEEKKNDGLS